MCVALAFHFVASTQKVVLIRADEPGPAIEKIALAIGATSTS